MKYPDTISTPWSADKHEHFLPTNLPSECLDVSFNLIESMQRLSDESEHYIKLYIALNLFFWHQDSSESLANPVPGYLDKVRKAIQLLQIASDIKLFKPESTNFDYRKDKDIGEIYGKSWEILSKEDFFVNSRERLYQRFERNGCSLEEYAAGKYILDSGAGCGNYSAALAYAGAKKITAIDIGLDGLRFGSKMLKDSEYNDKIEFEAASSSRLPFENECFDAVFSNSVVHVTGDYENCISEASRVVKTGGSFFLYVDAKMGMFELLMNTLLCGLKGVPEECFIELAHRMGIKSGRIGWMVSNFFVPYERRTKKDIYQLLEQNGFSILHEFKRGLDSDMIEKISNSSPYADIQYGEGEARFICVKN